MEATKKGNLPPEERQAAIDKMVDAWKAHKKQIELTSQEQFTSPEYQAALEELEKRRIARGSLTVKV